MRGVAQSRGGNIEGKKKTNQKKLTKQNKRKPIRTSFRRIFCLCSQFNYLTTATGSRRYKYIKSKRGTARATDTDTERDTATDTFAGAVVFVYCLFCLFFLLDFFKLLLCPAAALSNAPNLHIFVSHYFINNNNEQ